MSASVQPFPALDAATEAALRASIQRFGVLVPVVFDQNGRILDGHHRARLATESSLPYPVNTVEVADEDEAEAIARTLNADRRHLTPEQRVTVSLALREEGHSFQAIANVTGVSKSQAKRDVESIVPRGTMPERVATLDGRMYPARQPQDAPVAPSRPGRRTDRVAPFAAESDRQKQLANGQRKRVEGALSEISGLCHGLRDVDFGMAAAAMEPGEIRTWTQKAGELAAALRQVKSKLQEVEKHGR